MFCWAKNNGFICKWALVFWSWRNNCCKWTRSCCCCLSWFRSWSCTGSFSWTSASFSWDEVSDGLSEVESSSASALSRSSTGGKMRGILGFCVKSGTSICSSCILLIAPGVKNPRLWSKEWKSSRGPDCERANDLYIPLESTGVGGCQS